MAKKPTAPGTLGEMGARFWGRVVEAYGLEPHHLDVLEQCCMALDRSEACRRQVDAEGLTVDDRFDQKKAHPLLATERDARAAFRQFYRELGLDVEPTGPVGRPTGR